MNAFLLERGVRGVGGVWLESVDSTTLGNCITGNYRREGRREGEREECVRERCEGGRERKREGVRQKETDGAQEVKDLRIINTEK